MLQISLHLVLACILFLLINWIGRHATDLGYRSVGLFEDANDSVAMNFSIKGLSPTVFVTFVSAIFIQAGVPELRLGIFWTTTAYFSLRLAAIFVFGRQGLVSWKGFLAHAMAGIATTYWAYNHLILPQKPLIPNMEAAGGEVWLGIFAFLYAVANKAQLATGPSDRRRNRYIQSKYEAARDNYRALISTLPSQALQLAAYAILIHENYNRPVTIRWIERVLHPWARTTGEMQVSANKSLSDAESVELGVERLRAAWIAATAIPDVTVFDAVSSAVASFNQDQTYIDDVSEIMAILSARAAPEYARVCDQMYSTPALPG